MNSSSCANNSSDRSCGISSSSRLTRTKSDRWSAVWKNSFRASSVASSRPPRISSIAVSNRCAKRTKASRPNAPAPPLIECTARNTMLIVSSSPSPSSRICSPSCSASMSSSHSMKNDARISAIGSVSLAILSPLYPATIFRALISFVGSNGFTIHPVAPASRAFIFSS